MACGCGDTYEGPVLGECLIVGFREIALKRHFVGKTLNVIISDAPSGAFFPRSFAYAMAQQT